MAGADSSAKDREMAARLMKNPYHSPEGVRRRKERQFRRFMAQFGKGLTGTAAYRRFRRKAR